jgi:tetratricopeptide (TPR) repeat protein
MYIKVNPQTLRDEIIDRVIYENEVSEALSRCESKGNDYLEACSKLGELYRIDGKYQEAETLLKSVLQSLAYFPNQKLVFLTELRLAIVYQYAGDWENSLNLFEKIEFEPIEEFESFVYQCRGKLEFEMGNFWMAIHYFERAKRLRLDKLELLESTELAIQRVKKELKLR